MTTSAQRRSVVDLFSVCVETIGVMTCSLCVLCDPTVDYPRATVWRQTDNAQRMLTNSHAASYQTRVCKKIPSPHQERGFKAKFASVYPLIGACGGITQADSGVGWAGGALLNGQLGRLLAVALDRRRNEENRKDEDTRD